MSKRANIAGERRPWKLLLWTAIAGLIFGLIAVALASVNIFGGFAVTARMLAMYKKKERKDA